MDQDPDQDKNNPFSLEIQVMVVFHTLRFPKEKYNGMTDPIDHVACFESTPNMYDATDAIKCRMFPSTLIGMPVLEMNFSPLI